MSTVISIVGNIGSDPEYKLSGKGNGWIRLNVAVYQGKDQNGDEKKPAWYTVKVFSGKGGANWSENVHASLKKGDRVGVIGTIETEYWTDRDGNERQTQVVIADFIGPDLRFASATVTRNPREASAGTSYGNRAGASTGGYAASEGGYGATEPVLVGPSDDEFGPF